MSRVYFTLFPLHPGTGAAQVLVNFFNLIVASGISLMYIISIKRLTMFKGNTMKNAIVIVPVDSSIDRPDLEGLEGTEFEDVSQAVNTISGDKEELKDVIGIYSLTDFVDLSNDEQFDTDGSWITWITIKDTSNL